MMEWTRKKNQQYKYRRGHAPGLERLENGRRNARPRVGANPDRRQEAPDWGIQSIAGRHQGGTLDWSIRGKQPNRPGSSRAEHKGGVNKVPTREPGSVAKGWSN